MKKKNYVYRIKDLNSNKYYRYRYIFYPRDSVKEVTSKKEFCYRFSKKNTYGTILEYQIYFDEVGHFYNTKQGAEKIISEFTDCNIHDRKTKAGRILNSRFNFVVVKSEMKLKDVVDETENVRDSKETELQKSV